MGENGYFRGRKCQIFTAEMQRRRGVDKKTYYSLRLRVSAVIIIRLMI
jgi:hypothetical protein